MRPVANSPSCFGESPNEAGFYRLQTSTDSVIAHIAFNYDRTESPQEYFSASELADTGRPVLDGNEAGSLLAALQTEANSSTWWPYLLWAALLALLIEAVVLRFWQPARVSPAAKAAAVRRKTAVA